jgi:uncharacterized protein
VTTGVVEGRHRRGFGPRSACPFRQTGEMSTTRPHQIATLDQLRELYCEPSTLVRSKVRPSLDAVSTTFLSTAPFVLIATANADGRVDVSPRGGPAGFIRVQADSSVVAIPDLNGNNLLDTLSNIIATGRAGLLAIHPGRDETLRVNGTAHLTVDPTVLASFTDELKVPKSAIIIEPDEVFVHCAKAFRRSGMWHPDTWRTDAPDAVDMLKCQLDLEPSADELRKGFEIGYAEELAED